MNNMSGLISDFWWLSADVPIENLLIGVGHHQEVIDGENVPPFDSWYRSLDSRERPSNNIEYYPINFIKKWSITWDNTNVYRTLEIFARNTEKAILLGPLLVDIDNSDERLDCAQAVAKQVVNYLIRHIGLSSDDLRVFFSGHKGFNVEVRPDALGISGPVPDQIKFSSKKLDEIISFLRDINDIQDISINVVSSQGTFIDRIYGDRFGYKLKHPYIRLHNSINKWVREDGSECARRKIEITLEQL